jgi:hypothetical protein
MQVIREKILLNNQENNLKINLFNNTKEYGIYKEVSDLLENEETNSINKHIDYEKRLFKYTDNTYCLIYLHFGQDAINLSTLSWEDAGFNNEDIMYNKQTYKNSFIIFDIFNTFDFRIQKKLSTNYITKLGNSPNFNLGMSIQHPIYSDIQLSNIYIPEYILTKNISTVYGRLSFFNAKTGKITMFLNNNYNSIITPEKMYCKIRIDDENKKWEFLDLHNNTIIFKELLNNDEYVNKINNTIIKKNEIKQQYPSKDDNKFITFDYKTGKYF